MNTRLPGVLVIGALAGLLACSSSTKKEKVLELIAVTPASPSLAQGAQQQLTATGKYSDGSTQDLTASVTWASLDTTVATVSAGLVIAGTVTAGSAVVTATLADQVGFTEVTVTGSQLAIIRLSSPSVKVPAGVAVGLVAMGEYTDGSERNLSSVATWGSAAPETATVAGGAVTGVAAGDTTVTATVGDLTAAATVTVTSAILQSIVIAPGNAPTVATGRTEAFSAFGTYDDLSVVDLTEAVTWASSDPTIASISNDAGTRGQATSLLAGSTDVTAALGAVTSAAQPLTVADGATDYVESRTPFAWTDMTGSTFVVVGDDEQVALPAVDGFSFTFYGTAYTTDQNPRQHQRRPLLRRRQHRHQRQRGDPVRPDPQRLRRSPLGGPGDERDREGGGYRPHPRAGGGMERGDLRHLGAGPLPGRAGRGDRHGGLPLPAGGRPGRPHHRRRGPDRHRRHPALPGPAGLGPRARPPLQPLNGQ